MDLHQLLVFTKVVEHKSFSKAAEDIFLSQSTVSSHIHSLEKTLNVNLFDRVGRDSVLTPHGERLYQWALKILLLKDQAILDINEGMTELRGNIRIAASSVPGQFIIPRMVKQFRYQYPNAVFHIDQFSSRIVAEKVLSGTVEMGILGDKYENDKLQYVPLLKEKLVLITSNHSNITGPVTLHDILEYPFIMRNSDSGTNAQLERLLKMNNISKDRLNIAAFTESGQSLIQFVIQDIGISIISEIAAKEHHKNNMLKMHEIIDFDAKRHFYLVHNQNKTQSMLSKLFIDSAQALV